MGELSEKRWAVISERGCEVAGVDHAEAVQLVGRLKSERVRGLCVVTAEAGRRIEASMQTPSNGAQPTAKKSTRAKRTSKK